MSRFVRGGNLSNPTGERTSKASGRHSPQSHSASHSKDTRGDRSKFSITIKASDASFCDSIDDESSAQTHRDVKKSTATVLAKMFGTIPNYSLSVNSKNTGERITTESKSKTFSNHLATARVLSDLPTQTKHESPASPGTQREAKLQRQFLEPPNAAYLSSTRLSDAQMSTSPVNTAIRIPDVGATGEVWNPLLSDDLGGMDTKSFASQIRRIIDDITVHPFGLWYILPNDSGDIDENVAWLNYLYLRGFDVRSAKTIDSLSPALLAKHMIENEYSISSQHITLFFSDLESKDARNASSIFLRSSQRTTIPMIWLSMIIFISVSVFLDTITGSWQNLVRDILVISISSLLALGVLRLRWNDWSTRQLVSHCLAVSYLIVVLLQNWTSPLSVVMLIMYGFWIAFFLPSIPFLSRGILIISSNFLAHLILWSRYAFFRSDFELNDTAILLLMCSFIILIAMICVVYYQELVSRYQFLSLTQLKSEKFLADMLLEDLLPPEIAQQFRKGTVTLPIAERHSHVTVLFSDMVRFTEFSGKVSPAEVVRTLSVLFRAFDTLIDEYKLEKIKTIGDALMVVGGMHNSMLTHTKQCVALGLAMLERASQVPTVTGASVSLRVGVHTGPVIAGVLSSKKIAFDVWGETVNIAARMESHSVSGRCQISRSTYKEVRNNFACYSRGTIRVKGIGRMKTYFAYRLDSARSKERSEISRSLKNHRVSDFIPLQQDAHEGDLLTKSPSSGMQGESNMNQISKEENRESVKSSSLCEDDTGSIIVGRNSSDIETVQPNLSLCLNYEEQISSDDADDEKSKITNATFGSGTRSEENRLTDSSIGKDSASIVSNADNLRVKLGKKLVASKGNNTESLKTK